MATKTTFHVNRLNETVDGYKVNEYLGLYLDKSDKLWKGIHLKTGADIVGPSGSFKMKRHCMKFVESFVDMDWNVTDEEEMYEKNGGFEAVKKRYSLAIEKATDEK